MIAIIFCLQIFAKIIFKTDMSNNLFDSVQYQLLYVENQYETTSLPLPLWQRGREV